ncbi:phospho-sugar mutase [Lancefieldella parvula]|uniref:Phosphoglucomutase/phosphomannomutase alpha/beta/alpha domain I n=1 Tax=Lancefieldella parvula (strain ATCC 33793 / DSM 20469 / CCUG 32760 / JCM 10300 / KCTC 3663 / VPI 0546 / 1246) TaxID=521095 RepID=C8W7K2_LANP1|nr:phospho-sugar mutase [Lancefieldella parvula]ACV51442.1 phosphoglucomutase/phosphomannomutase alpha/beta/alpha domain I [Lancefieldella parvula DSM 20469]MDU4868699.1 phospho-sugar mutase [Lancefieldella parvula]
MDAKVMETFESWRANVTEEDLVEELGELTKPEAEDKLYDAFYRSLAFGTAGLRGIIGVGTNRMNVYVVAQATQGLADYLNAHYQNPTVALARDSRLKGEDFQKVAAGVLAANGIRVYVYPRIEPVPTLSFAVRYLKTSAGIVLTASHNPKAYNGYKVYNDNGGQITDEAAAEISANIARVNPFDVKPMDFEEGLEKGLIVWTPEEVLDNFIEAIKRVSIPGFKAADGYKVVYTPLNGTGMECVTRILKEIGVNDVDVVPEQAEPDGNFPTCSYPNPEFREALELGLKLADKVKPNLLVATDPDADRMGTAIPHNGDYVLLSGNEMGVLLMDWLLTMAEERGEKPQDKVAVSTIVSSAMPDVLARARGFEMRRVLTGFKYIGDQIDQLKDAGEEDRFLMGFEESYGYLVGTHARDKDAIVATMLCVEMASWYAARNMDLYEAMDALYQRYGYYLNGVVNAAYPGAEGATKMAEIMSGLRKNPLDMVGNYKVVGVTDYAECAQMPRVSGLQKEASQTLPASNVIEYRLEGDNKVIFRPSGTEPKVKAYLFANGATREEAEARIAELGKAAQKVLL